MDNATLPCETAIIPTEEARQCSTGSTDDFERNKKKLNRKSPNSSKKRRKPKSVSELLSQPFGFGHRERLLWLQKRRKAGLWVQCDSCNRWRYLPLVVDRYELPAKWHCKMNPDQNLANCSLPEVPIDLHDEEDLIHSRFSAGSVVWARMPGWPWWPAMVDDCPDTEQFYWLDGFTDIPTSYHVTFFDKSDVTRAWISDEKLKSYSTNTKIADRVLNINKYAKRLAAAMKQAEDALKLPLSTRLDKYSFLTRYKGNISTPTKISKAAIEKYRKLLKRKFNVEFPSDSSDTETDSFKNAKSKTKNESYSVTPKKIRDTSVQPKQILKNVNNTNFTSDTNNATVDSTTLLNDTLSDTNDKDTFTKVTQKLSTIIEEDETNPIHNRPSSTASGDFEF